MAPNITIEGIDEAISNLSYLNHKVLKGRLVQTVRSYYDDQGKASISKIDPDDLIKILWETGDDDSLIKSKRKNLSGTKSALNKDLRLLFEEGKNPQGITLGRDNLFVMCDQAKDKILADFGPGAPVKRTASLQQIAQALQVIKEQLQAPDVLQDAQKSMLDDLRGAIQRLASEMGVSGRGDGAVTAPETSDRTLQTPDGAAEGATDQSRMPGLEKGRIEKVVEAADESKLDESLDLLDEEESPEESVAHDEVVEILEKPEELIAAAEESPEEPAQEQLADQDDVQDLVEVAEKDDLDIVEVLDEDEVLEPVAPEDVPVDETDEILEGYEEKDAVEEEGVTEEPAPDQFEEVDDAEEIVEIADEDALEESSEPLDEDEVLEAAAPEDVSEDEIDSIPEEPEDVIVEEVEEPESAEELTDEPDGRDADQMVEVVDESDLDGMVEALDEDEVVEQAVPQEDFQEPLEGPGNLFAEAAEADAEEITKELDNDLRDLEGIGAGHAPEPPPDSLGADLTQGETDEVKKARQLAKVFDSQLGTTERFFNQYILVPEGEYVVGSNSDRYHQHRERKTRLPSFYMGKFPVTNALFEVFVEKTGYVTTAERTGSGTVYFGRLRKEVNEETGAIKFIAAATVRSDTVRGACWYQPNGPRSNLHQKRDHPVVQISLEDALAFAAWTGKRLPTEEEWEAAARTLQGKALPWGDQWLADACNMEDNAIAGTMAVDAFERHTNSLGITDTLGNVLEWTVDIWEPGADHNGTCHVAKGGSWISEKDIRLFSRFKIDPKTSSNILGFRCVAD